MTIAGSLATRWPSGRPRILVTDAWLANAGDAALAIATDEMVRQSAATSVVLHAAYHSAELAAYLPQLRFTAPLEHLIGTTWAPPASGWAEAGPKLVAGADAVISQGGGFLMEAYEPWGRIAALAEVTRQGVPLALLGQTIDRFVRTLPGDDLEQVMRAAALVVVRDTRSEPPGSGQWMALAPLRLRLEEVRSRLTEFLEALPSSGPTTLRSIPREGEPLAPS